MCSEEFGDANTELPLTKEQLKEKEQQEKYVSHLHDAHANDSFDNKVIIHTRFLNSLSTPGFLLSFSFVDSHGIDGGGGIM